MEGKVEQSERQRYRASPTATFEDEGSLLLGKNGVTRKCTPQPERQNNKKIKHTNKGFDGQTDRRFVVSCPTKNQSKSTT